MKLWARCGLMVLLLAVSAPVAMAEDEDGSEYDEIVAKPVTGAKPRPRARVAPVKKVEPAPKLPDAPIPYQTLPGAVSAPAGVTGPMEHKVVPTLPTPAKVHNLPEAITAPDALMPLPAPMRSFESEPLPPPPPAPPAFVSGDVLNLKCETQVISANRVVTNGAFFIEVKPSEVFGDSARFKVMFADPRHESLIKETLCETVSCNIRISANFYELFNQRTKKGKSLKVTLDRRNGAYLAQNRDGETDTGDYEQGYCLPQVEGRKLF
ncbi:MAG: hypothetical protein AAGC58_00250 [Asticcacaulis sp.]